MANARAMKVTFSQREPHAEIWLDQHYSGTLLFLIAAQSMRQRGRAMEVRRATLRCRGAAGASTCSLTKARAPQPGARSPKSRPAAADAAVAWLGDAPRTPSRSAPQQNFQRLLQFRQATNVVIGSSADRVCIW